MQGHPPVRAPHSSRMAAEGLRLTADYAQPFCGPARAALMTGQQFSFWDLRGPFWGACDWWRLLLGGRVNKDSALST